jgi:3-hydroxyacyl-CoA dehydrogenase
MTEQCRTAAVLGAGVMGSAIAAHLAGAGIRTHLLDIVLPDHAQSAQRNFLAQQGLQKTLKAKPAAFYDADAAALVVPGNLDDDLESLRHCDLIIEAVVERLDVKKSLFTKIAPYINDHALLASNTSGLSLTEMNAVLPPSLQQRFLVLHFFNPVRYMRLLEIIPGPKTAEATLQRAAQMGQLLGKGIVHGKDTPNFVANRIGVHAIMKAIALMDSNGLSIEEVDKIAGKPMGRPSSAAFRTADLVGIDTFLHVSRNCFDALPNDEERQVFAVPTWIETLVKQGNTGAKAGAGFYKKVGKDILVLDAKTLEYRAQNKVRFDSLGAVRTLEDPGERLKALVNADDRAAKFAWQATASTMAYAARRLGEIADDILNIDRGMRWGFNWELGPFEMWDAIGVAEATERMEKDGIAVPRWVHDMLKGGRTSFYEGPQGAKKFFDVRSQALRDEPRDPQRLALPALHSQAKNIVAANMGASLVDLGDGCLCLEVHTKMNTVDDDVISMMHQGVKEAEKNFSALVIGNDGDHFGAGANLMLIYMAATNKGWEQIEKVIRGFQSAVQGLRYANVPVVAAPFNYTFGGAAEIAMGADACQAHAETYMGLVEVGVGLVPGGGGCLRLVERYTEHVQDIDNVDLLPFVGAASLNIAMAKVSTGAEEARRLRYLLPTDGISLNRDHLLHQAKQKALGMARAGYRPPRPRKIRAAGYDAAATIGVRVWGLVESQFASEHDALIANKVATICCGGKVAANTELSEQHYLDLEREAFLSLCGMEKTQARMQSILMNNKPLRN